MIAYIDILSQPVTPLKAEETEKCYQWLIEGTEEEVREIHGGTGVCPKLLHMFGQISHLAARMAEVSHIRMTFSVY